MLDLIHELILQSAQDTPHQEAPAYQGKCFDHGAVAVDVGDCAARFLLLGLGRPERVAVYIEKRFEAVIAVFGAAAAGGTFVTVNPRLNPD